MNTGQVVTHSNRTLRKGGKPVTVTVYLPRDMTALQDEIAQVHAEAVISQVNRLTCPVEQKREIVQRVQEKVAQMAVPASDEFEQAVA